MDFGIFLLLQSPSTRPSQEIYERGLEQAQAAESLGFRNAWMAEHHFSTYGYLSRPLQLATYIAAKTTKLRVEVIGVFPKLGPQFRLRGTELQRF